MVSRDQKRAALQEKYQLLRFVTNSYADMNMESIWVDASKYMQEIRQNVERLNQDIVSSSYGSDISSNETCYVSTTTINNDGDDDDDDQNSLPNVSVEALEKGFLINVFSERSCPGLLVFILEALEELGLELLNARISCSDCFQLEAFGEENGVDGLDAQVVRQAVLQAIKNWTDTT